MIPKLTYQLSETTTGSQRFLLVLESSTKSTMVGEALKEKYAKDICGAYNASGSYQNPVGIIQAAHLRAMMIVKHVGRLRYQQMVTKLAEEIYQLTTREEEVK